MNKNACGNENYYFAESTKPPISVPYNPVIIVKELNKRIIARVFVKAPKELSIKSKIYKGI